MPAYDYLCTACENRFEVVHGMTETPAIICPACGAAAKKAIPKSVGIITTGWRQIAERPSCGSDVTCCGRGVPCGTSNACHGE